MKCSLPEKKINKSKSQTEEYSNMMFTELKSSNRYLKIRCRYADIHKNVDIGIN